MLVMFYFVFRSFLRSLSVYLTHYAMIMHIVSFLARRVKLKSDDLPCGIGMVIMLAQR